MPEQVSRVVLELRAAKDTETTYENFVHFLASLRSSLKTSLFKRLFGNLDTITLEIACLDQTIYFILNHKGRMTAFMTNTKGMTKMTKHMTLVA